MLRLVHPWLLVLLALPLAVRWLLPAHAERKTAVRSPFFALLAQVTGRRPSAGAAVLRQNRAQRVLVPLAWLLIVLALARPQWVGAPIEKIESARDLMLVVDLSTSMQERDFLDEAGERVDRLTAVKQVLRDFVAARETDRLSLVVFGQAAFLQAPFTLDHELVRTLLEQMQIGMAGPRTMMGDAIGLAIRAFESSDADEKVAIVLTDGNDTGSKVPPLKAAELADREGISLYTIGIGDPQSVGEAPLDEETLRGIAETTGGRYFRGEDRASVQEVYRQIDQLEPLDFDVFSYRPTFELYFWPLALLLVLVSGYHLAMAARNAAMRRRVEAADA